MNTEIGLVGVPATIANAVQRDPSARRDLPITIRQAAVKIRATDTPLPG